MKTVDYNRSFTDYYSTGNFGNYVGSDKPVLRFSDLQSRHFHLVSFRIFSKKALPIRPIFAPCQIQVLRFKRRNRG